MTQPTQTYYKNSDGSYDSRWALGDKPEGGGGGDWQFAKAQQYGAKIPLYPIYPRPTVEVNAFACHLWAHSTMPYLIKPGATHGAWPHKWELTDAPVGTTIGGELTRTVVDGLISHTVGESYQEILLSGEKTGTLNFSYKATDQLLNEVTYSHAAVVDNSKFVFLDPAAPDDTGDGTILSPKKLFSSVWVTGNAGKTIVMRTGHHECTETGDAVNIGFNKATRPTAIIAYPGEAVTASGSFWRDGGAGATADDLLVRDIKFTDYEGASNTHVFLFNGTQKRVAFQNVTFANIINGAVGDNNQGCIVFLAGTGTHDNIVVLDCSMESTCKVSLFIIFKINHCLLERPSAYDVDIPASNGAGFFNIKDQSDNVCVRGAFFRGAIASAPPCLISNQNTPGNNIEHCWGTYIVTSGAAVYWNQQRFTAGGSNQFDYANSIYADGNAMAFALWGDSDLLVVNEGIAAYAWALYSPGIAAGVTGGVVPNQLLTVSQMNSTTGKLEGTGTAYRLSLGAELWSEAA